MLADRLGKELLSRTDRTCAALLPVVGKSLIEHTQEALPGVGIRQVSVRSSRVLSHTYVGELVDSSNASPAAESPREEWEWVRDEAPSGLIGPTRLLLAPNAPVEERMLGGALYARQRSTAANAGWLLRGAVAPFSRCAWLPPASQVSPRQAGSFLGK